MTLHMNVVWVIVILTVVRPSSAQTDNPCLVDCTNKPAGSFVPDPYNCHNFYGCRDDGTPTDTSIQCPDGEYFDPNTTACTDEVVPCQRPCPPASCPLTCHDMLDVIAVPHNCSRFLVCLPDGVSAEEECPAAVPYFDGSNCQQDAGMCCDPCIPKCVVPGTEIVDPYDCTKYIFCSNDNSMYGASCNNGQYFNPLLAQCESNNGHECHSVCSESLTTTTDYSTTTYYPWTTTDYQTTYPWTTTDYPTTYPWTTTGYQTTYPWTTTGYQTTYPWTTTDYQTTYPWTTTDYQTTYPWTTTGYQTTYPWTTTDYQTTYPWTTTDYQTTYPWTTTDYQTTYPWTTTGYQTTYPWTTTDYQTTYPWTTTGYPWTTHFAKNIKNRKSYNYRNKPRIH